MAKQNEKDAFRNLPPSAVIFIERVIKKMRHSRRARRDVQAELIAHFEDGIKDCAGEQEKEQEALRLIADFGDIRLLALLLRRAKKRCRSLWRKVIERTLQAVVALFVTLIVYTIWFSTGKAVIDVDYTAMFNRMNRPEIKDEDNAWPSYEHAISHFVEPNDPEFKKVAFNVGERGEQSRLADLSDDDRKRIGEWVGLNEAAWKAFEIGAGKSYCYREYTHDPNDDEKWMMGILLPHLGDIRNIARVGVWRLRIAVEQGRIDQVLGDCIAVARAGSHWQRMGTLVEQLVGMSISGMACREIVGILEDHDVSADLIEQIYSQLSDVYPDGYAPMNVEGERLMFMDTVQHVFTKGGFGGGHLIPGAWNFFADDQGLFLEGQDKTLFMPLYAAKSMLHARRDETIAKANELYSRQKELAKMTPYQRRAANVGSCDDMLNSLSARRFFLLYFMTPAFDRVAATGFRGEASYRATLTILALKRRQGEKGGYPDSLNELVAAGLLDELPMDPYSNKPLLYKKTEGNFTLYSLGPNFEDDNGQPGKTSKGRPQDWEDNGDTVFWPPPKP